MDYFGRLRQKLGSELNDRVITFWMAHSIDRECGGFFSCLERDGTVYDTFKQMWMQWREVYMFAALYNSAYRKEDYLAIAEAGFDFLFRSGRKPDGSYAFMLDRQGRILAEKADGAEVFSESFAAIACAELFRATGKRQYRQEAFRCLEVYRKNTAAPAGRTENGTAVWHPLAWPMIELNVLQIMRNAFGDGIPEEQIDGCIETIFTFLNPATGLFHENRLADGSFDLNSQTGRFSNPGHALEGLSFILEELRRRKTADPAFYQKYIGKVLTCAERVFDFGWDKEQGGICYFKDVEGKPLFKSECMLKAWWPQNETATAMLRAYELSGEERFLDRFEKVNSYAWLFLRDPDYPEWFAYAAVNGRQVHTYKGSRWKTFFHVPRYLLNCLEVCSRMEERP